MKRLKSFIIAGIVCLVAVLFIIPVESYTTFVHEESISYPSPPRVWSSIVYEDGTAVFRIIRRDTSVKLPDRTCLVQKLMLRILYPNGTLTELDMELNIPPLNYCIVAAKPDNFDPINISALKPGYLLLRYYNATDPSKPETWEEWGMVIDWQGQTYEPKFLGLSFIDANTGTVVPGLSAVTVNINRAKGFLRLAALRETTDCEWQQYSIGENKELIQLSGGVIKLPIFKSAQFATIATVDEGYAIVFANSSDTVNNADPLLPRGGLFALSLAYGQKSINSPSLLYQVPLANLLFTALKCDIAFVGVGHVCTLTVQQNLGDATNPTKSDLYYLKITFLSSGSVTSFTSISRALPTNINVKVTEWVVSSLPYGGYVLVSHLKTQPTGLVMYAYVFDEDETNGIPWELDEPSVTNVAGTYKILPNNTLYFAQQEPSEVRFAGSTSGVLRLTVDGTTYFDQLSAEGQAQFFNNLVNEISTMLTIPPSRLKSSGRFQVDITISPEKQYLISLDIIQTKDKSEKSVESIIKDLDTMILNKEVSPISLGKTTHYLDATYGLRTTQELELKGKDEGFGGLDPFPKPSVGKINDDEHKIDIKDDQLDVKAAKNLEKKNSKSSFQEMIN
ncbi:3192_t:CDS:2 [Funneliformis caledonium]|uniref:3192_t:CDS:1 n=1 Tax=Funneliformis caledonium TaxID=1117310 RepID=A0A9N8Z7L6_9GLOM|nr:3192_t:CDS:2 [Funneliformis caledonium]